MAMKIVYSHVEVLAYFLKLQYAQQLLSFEN